jgi:allantoicase
MSSPAPAFVGLVDLASAAFGGSALGASDDFFGGVDNLVRPEPARFEPDRYTERGKWMDGWESRRKRGGGHDWCVVELGAPGQIRAFDVDTHHFVGNHPPFAAIDALRAPRGTTLERLLGMRWRPLVAQSPLAAGSHNLFTAEPGEDASHVRLSIFPDGGVARLRAFGTVTPFSIEPEIDEVSRVEGADGLVDLAALRNGAAALASSDARFGAMNNLLMPGRARHMGEGWETRRARAPEHRNDWILVKLAARGTVRLVEIDTNHYKGNFPERVALAAIDAPGAAITDLVRAGGWETILSSGPLRADHRHFFRGEIARHAPVSHVRLDVFPDGGVSRLRLWGALDG